MSLKKLIADLELKNPLAKISMKPKKYNKISENMGYLEDSVFMADLITMPKTKQGYRYLLTVCDIATKDFDMEPLKSKESKDVKTAFMKILTRPYLDHPYDLITDGGTEFKSDFHNYVN
ncbi:MAG: hypothetical protein EOO06_20520 [Chitinophagaceae bacterium]|nr:MAG: hypothetical protein EOO06_20520 [Chitinophagaceae bacterium]